MTTTQAINCNDFFISAIKNTPIATERKVLLEAIATKLGKLIQEQQHTALNFICTHNSRRSQLAQVWAYYAADYFNIPVEAYSGGTEVTAFHRNTVQALQASGFKFSLSNFSHSNPLYSISYNKARQPLKGFSKLYDDSTNTTPFIAVTTCNHADENCPFIPEALARFHLPYTDPKYADGTPEQAEAYIHTNTVIAAEIAYLFKTLQNHLSS